MPVAQEQASQSSPNAQNQAQSQNQPPKCSTCWYLDGPSSECRISPPTFKQANDPVGYWPTVNPASGWCGDWVATVAQRGKSKG